MRRIALYATIAVVTITSACAVPAGLGEGSDKARTHEDQGVLVAAAGGVTEQFMAGKPTGQEEFHRYRIAGDPEWSYATAMAPYFRLQVDTYRDTQGRPPVILLEARNGDERPAEADVEDLGEGWTRHDMRILMTTLVGEYLTVEIGHTPSYGIRILPLSTDRLRAPDVRVSVDAIDPEFRQGNESAIFDGNPETGWELQYTAQTTETADVIVDFDKRQTVLGAFLDTDHRTVAPGILREPHEEPRGGESPVTELYDDSTKTYHYGWPLAADRDSLVFRFRADRENEGSHDFFIDDVVLIRDLRIVTVPRESLNEAGFMDMRAGDSRW